MARRFVTKCFVDRAFCFRVSGPDSRWPDIFWVYKWKSCLICHMRLVPGISKRIWKMRLDNPSACGICSKTTSRICHLRLDHLTHVAYALRSTQSFITYQVVEPDQKLFRSLMTFQRCDETRLKAISRYCPFQAKSENCRFRVRFLREGLT